MGNALFYGACGFAALVGTSCIGVLVGKFFLRNRKYYLTPEEKFELWKKDWDKTQVWDP